MKLTKELLGSVGVHVLLLALLGWAAGSQLTTPHASTVYQVQLVPSGATQAQKAPQTAPTPAAPQQQKAASERVASGASPAAVAPAATKAAPAAKATESAATAPAGAASTGSEAAKPTGPGFDTEAVQTDVAPTLLSARAALYPESLRQKGAEGTVQLQLLVGKNGRVESTTVLSSSGYPALDRAAVQAAASYRFAPATKSGYQVRSYAYKTFSFRIR